MTSDDSSNERIVNFQKQNKPQNMSPLHICHAVGPSLHTARFACEITTVFNDQVRRKPKPGSSVFSSSITHPRKFYIRIFSRYKLLTTLIPVMIQGVRCGRAFSTTSLYWLDVLRKCVFQNFKAYLRPLK